MDLKDYIKNTITAISEAIIESQEELSDKGVIVNPEKVEVGKNGEKLLRSDGWRYVQNLEFDILVSAEDDSGSSGGGGLKVAGLLSIGAELQESISQQQANKIKFTIPVAFATTETPTEYRKRNTVVSAR
ncbi:MAG: hypothetical protein VXW38_12675 [Bacteroidota bacterium]|nr:hypothetical protein [Bacteroidota bacterium]